MGVEGGDEVEDFRSGIAVGIRQVGGGGEAGEFVVGCREFGDTGVWSLVFHFWLAY